MRFMTVPPTSFRENILLRITANVDNYNIFTEAGSPNRVVNVLVILDIGVVVGSTAAGTPAFMSGTGWKAGSTLSLVNKGNVIGAGGNGGDILAVGGTGTPGCLGVGTLPITGGDAISLHYPMKIDNVAGNIYAGGGGGAAGSSHVNGFTATSQGGGGGGGAGNNGGSGGGNAGLTAPNFSGSNGLAGGSAGGTGGAGATDTTVGGIAQSGGNGGGYGEVGGASILGTNQSLSLCTTTNPGATGGKAVALNGNAVTWIAGNNASQVKGAVS